VAALCKHSSIHRGAVLTKGRFFYNPAYAVLEKKEKKLYFFPTEHAASPQRVIDLAPCKYSASGCSDCKKGFYCIKLDGCKGDCIMCVKQSSDQEKWMHNLVAAGVTATDDEEESKSAKKEITNFFDLSSKNIDLVDVPFTRYRGKVCIVVNVASQ